jgi:transposase
MANHVLQSRFEALERLVTDMQVKHEHEVTELRKQLKASRAEVEALKIKLSKSNIRIKELEIENKQLKAKLAKYEVKRDSSNSSIPPSQDPFRKKNTSLRKSSGKKSGGQKGHKGHHLKMVEHPDQVVDVKVDLCSSCRQSLTLGDHHLYRTYQVTDIPPVKPQVTEYRVYQAHCPCCGNKEVAPHNRPGKSPTSYGSNIEALVGYLSVRQYLPFNRIVEFLNNCFGIKMSEGTVQNILIRLSKKSEPTYLALHQQLSTCKVLGSDETGMNVNGKQHWLWTWQNEKITWIAAAKSRGFKVVEDLFPNGLQQSIMVSDRLAAQLKQNVAGRQVCLAHLLREIKGAVQNNAKAEWLKEFKSLLLDTIQLKKHIDYEYLDQYQEQIVALHQRKDQLLEVELQQGITAHAFQKSMKKVSAHLLTCLSHKDVPPDNNASERAIRNAKVKQKVSTMFKTMVGMETFAVLRTIIDTAIKKGLDPLATIANPQLIIAE